MTFPGWKISGKSVSRRHGESPPTPCASAVCTGGRWFSWRVMGGGHKLAPSGINYRANIDALKRSGVTDLISVSACGSYRAELYPGLFVFVDQFVDRTFKRESSFFGNGCVAHVPLAYPVAPLLVARLVEAAKAENIAYRKGRHLSLHGRPRLLDARRILDLQGAGHDVVGMTAMPEAKLAREAELSYATVAMVTDFDCWHPEHDSVDVATVIKVVRDNAHRAASLLARLIRDFPADHEPCPVGSDRALEAAFITAPEARDPEMLRKLDAVAGRVLGRK